MLLLFGSYRSHRRRSESGCTVKKTLAGYDCMFQFRITCDESNQRIIRTTRDPGRRPVGDERKNVNRLAIHNDKLVQVYKAVVPIS